MKWRSMHWDVAGRFYVGRADVETQTGRRGVAMKLNQYYQIAGGPGHWIKTVESVPAMVGDANQFYRARVGMFFPWEAKTALNRNLIEHEDEHDLWAVLDYGVTGGGYDKRDNYPTIVSDNVKHNAACAIKACPFAKHEDGMFWIPGARIFTGASIPGRNDRVQFALVIRESDLQKLNILLELGELEHGHSA